MPRNSAELMGQAGTGCWPVSNPPLQAEQPVRGAPMKSARSLQSRPTVAHTDSTSTRKYAVTSGVQSIDRHVRESAPACSAGVSPRRRWRPLHPTEPRPPDRRIISGPAQKTVCEAGEPIVGSSSRLGKSARALSMNSSTEATWPARMAARTACSWSGVSVMVMQASFFIMIRLHYSKHDGCAIRIALDVAKLSRFYRGAR